MSPRAFRQPWWTPMDWCLVSDLDRPILFTSYIPALFFHFYVFFFVCFVLFSVHHTLTTPSSLC